MKKTAKQKQLKPRDKDTINKDYSDVCGRMGELHVHKSAAMEPYDRAIAECMRQVIALNHEMTAAEAMVSIAPVPQEDKPL